VIPLSSAMRSGVCSASATAASPSPAITQTGAAQEAGAPQGAGVAGVSPTRTLRSPAFKVSVEGQFELLLQPSTLRPATHRAHVLALRKRTPEELEALRQDEEQKAAKRYRAMYELLDLKIMVQKCGTLEVSGRFGVSSGLQWN
jgi:hypothetical protein